MLTKLAAGATLGRAACRAPGSTRASCRLRASIWIGLLKEVRDLLHVDLQERQRHPELALVGVLLDVFKDVVDRSRYETVLKLATQYSLSCFLGKLR